MKDIVIDFGLGETYKGTNDAGTEINTALEGRIYDFPITEDVAAAMNMSKRTVGRRVKAMIMRNDTGSALNPGEVVTIDKTAGIAGAGKATALAGASGILAYVVDPAISGTVATDDLFLAIVKGPTTPKMLAAGVSVTGGDACIGAASGRVTKGTWGTTDAAYILGTFLATSSSNGDTLQPVDFHPIWS